jgi:cytosine/adenosine deaminase-related metal-dependent hydrolase
MAELVVRGGTIVTMSSGWEIAAGDLHVVDGRIAQVGGAAVPRGDDYEILDAEGALVLPGFVQSHVHVCQTLARGRADDLPLLDWLRRVVWPYEAALSRADVSAAARLAFTELLRGGTTTVQDMGTVHHTDAIFEVAEACGVRLTGGKAMMDRGEAVPPGLVEHSERSIADSLALAERWHGQASGRLRYAFAPRFVLSCSEELLRRVSFEARRLSCRVHTHASENRDELAAVRRERGEDNVAYLHKVGLSGTDVGLAHCIWLSPSERELLGQTGTHVLHCPSSNLKLASGVAEVPELMDAGVSVSLGADGAPCNNNLDAFMEMRLAALIAKPRLGAHVLPARHVVKMATLGGARALGLESQIGSLEPGKKADLIVVDVTAPHVVPCESPYSALVYACRPSDVRHVVVDGRPLVRDRALLTLDAAAAAAEGQTRGRNLFRHL